MNDIIEQYYLNNNYPNSDKLYKILKKKGVTLLNRGQRGSPPLKIILIFH